MKMNKGISKAIAKTSILIVLGMGLINSKYAQASTNLDKCFNNQAKINTLAHAQMREFDYYLVEIESTQIDRNRNVVKVGNSGDCYTVVKQKQIDDYPLSNFLEKEVAYNLLKSYYLTFISQLGGKQSFINALIGELDADSPHIFFKDDVEVLKQLGIDLEKIDSSLFIIGEEGIPGHPELQFKE